MSLGLLLVAVFATGTGVALQAKAAISDLASEGSHAGLLLRLIRHPVYLAALATLGIGFLAAVLALRDLPVFLVQAGRASSLAVTALLAVTFLGARLRRTEIIAVITIGVGLVLLALSAHPGPARDAGTAVQVGVILSTVALVSASAFLGRLQDPRTGPLLAIVAGIGFGVLAFAIRAVGSLAPLHLVTNPMTWAACAGGIVGLHSGALAMQRTSVMAVTALMIGVETVLGAALGLWLGGDHVAHGRWGIALPGFALVLVSATVLARFGGHPDPPP